ncbi:hypothetical protein N9L68_04280 [bacterium]|nr:hypothetical protein [bacterium]
MALALPDSDVHNYVNTLSSVLNRIVDAPGDARVRRLRSANTRSWWEVGTQEAAFDLLRLAGFADCVDYKDLGIDDAGKPSPSSPRSFGAPPQRPQAKTGRRKRIAYLTEYRIQNPAEFRKWVLKEGFIMRGKGGIIKSPRTIVLIRYSSSTGQLFLWLIQTA